MAALVTLQQAKDQIQKPTMPPGDPDEPDLILKLAQAEAIIVNFIGDGADPSWSAGTAPGEVTAAILLMLGGLYRHHGDLMEADEDLWNAIKRLLRRYRTEALA